METFKIEIIPIQEADKLIPSSILVKVYKIIVDEESEKENKPELDKTIEFFPKKYKRKSKYGKKK